MDGPPGGVEVLLLGGRSGVGKSSVAAEASELLQAAGVAHCLIDGDALDAAHPKGVLLTGADDVVAHRLGVREVGSALQRHLHRSAVMAVHLEAEAGDDVVRVSTDGRTVAEVAAEALRARGWLPTSAGAGT